MASEKSFLVCFENVMTKRECSHHIIMGKESWNHMQSMYDWIGTWSSMRSGWNFGDPKFFPKPLPRTMTFGRCFNDKNILINVLEVNEWWLFSHLDVGTLGHFLFGACWAMFFNNTMSKMEIIFPKFREWKFKRPRRLALWGVSGGSERSFPPRLPGASTLPN